MTAWLKSTALRNTLSVAGALLATFSAVLFLVVFLADLFGLHTNPYIGIVFFLILPGFFVFGLLMIPFGAWIERRRRHGGKPTSDGLWPKFDLNDPAQRNAAAIVFVLTLANIIIVSLASYRGIEYMDSVQFCGQMCHDVMQPEFVAYQDGPHSRVACVQCHISHGVSLLAHARVSGLQQVFDTMRHTYPLPMPSPLMSL